MSVVQLAVPIFFLLIGVEILVSVWRRRAFYRLNDSVADLSTALIFSIAGIGITIVWLAAYEWVRLRFSIVTLFGLPEVPSGAPLLFGDGGPGLVLPAVLAWAAVLVAVDFLYYWFHRATHRVNFLWACHVTHHSSEEFNLTVALRQCAFQRVFEYFFMLPLALLGVPWFMMLICHEIMKLYQFWVHTRFFRRLGFMERFLLTPSHHRVHHGRDPEYLDKNHGGIFILWDKWFGTFAEEKAEPHYGLTKPLDRWNPLWTNVHHYVYLWRNLKLIPGWGDKLRFLFKPPGWKPASMREAGEPEVKATPPVPADYRPYDPPLSRRLKIYVLVQFAVWLVLSLLFLRFARRPDPDPIFLLILAIQIVLGLGSLGAVLDRHRLALRFESLRLLGSLPCFYLYINLANGLPAFPGVALMAFCALSLGWFWFLREESNAGIPAGATNG